MVTYVVGDLFSSPAQVLVNTVNTVGVMGKGLAYTFKRVYPEMFEEYKRHCDNESLTVGKLHLYKSPQKWILNFPTKKHWRAKSKIEYIEAGLKKFRDTYKKKEIRSISFPMLGCENGGLEWDQVQPLMERYLADVPSDLEVYIHLFRPDLMPFPDYRNYRTTAQLKRRLRGEIDFVSFCQFWAGLDRGKLAELALSKATVQRVWSRLKDGRYLSAGDLIELVLPEADTQVNHRDFPKLQEPEGYVFVVQLPDGFYRIGRTADPAKYIRAISPCKEVAIFESQTVKQTVQSLLTRFADRRITPRKQQFRLDRSHLAAIEAQAAKQRNVRLAMKVADILQDQPFVQPVLMSDSSEPTSEDKGIQLISTKNKALVKQKDLAL